MKIKVRDVRSIVEADITVSTIALITGQNASGKSSLINAAAAALLGEQKIYGATKADTSGVVKEGTSTASVEVSGDNWSRITTWPGDTFEEGVAPAVTPVLLGQEDPAGEYSAKDWAAFVRSIAPTETKIGFKDFIDRMESDGATHGLDKWKLTLSDALRKGWDAAAKVAKDEALKSRREWEATTGDNWGSDKAFGWAHEDWQEGTLPEDFEEEVNNLKSELARSRAQQEVTGGQLEELKAHHEEMAKEQSQVKSSIETLRVKQSENEKALRKFPMSKRYHCPCCEEELEIKGGELVMFEPGEFVAGSDEHNTLLTEKDDLERNYKELAERNGSLVAKMAAEMAMIQKLKVHDESLRDPDLIERLLTQAIGLQDAARRTLEARAQYDRWLWFTEAEKLLAPSGMRFEATKAAVDDLQPRVSEIASYLFPDQIVEMKTSEDGVSFLVDGRDYKSLAWRGDPNSYRLAIQIMVQILAADRLQPESPIFIDRFDTLDLRRQNGVLTFFLHSGRPVVIGKTVAAAPEVDRLAERGVGVTYWIENGIVGRV